MKTHFLYIFYTATFTVPLIAMNKHLENKVVPDHQPVTTAAPKTAHTAYQNMPNYLNILALAAEQNASTHTPQELPQKQPKRFRFILPKPAPLITQPNSIEQFASPNAPSVSVQPLAPVVSAINVQTSKKRKKDEVTPFPCIKCLDENFDHPKLTAHILTQHTPFRMYTCEQFACTYKTNNFSDLKKHHLKKHTSESVQPLSLAKKREINKIVNPFLAQLGHSYACQECAGLFAHELALKCHISKDHKTKTAELSTHNTSDNGLNSFLAAESLTVPAAAQFASDSLDFEKTAEVPLPEEYDDFDMENLALILEFAPAPVSPTKKSLCTSDA